MEDLTFKENYKLFQICFSKKASLEYLVILFVNDKFVIIDSSIMYQNIINRRYTVNIGNKKKIEFISKAGVEFLDKNIFYIIINKRPFYITYNNKDYLI